MTASSQPIEPPPSESDDAEAIIDQEAAEIDARSPDAPEQIAQLAETADSLGLATPEPYEVTPPDTAHLRPDERVPSYAVK